MILNIMPWSTIGSDYNVLLHFGPDYLVLVHYGPDYLVLVHYGPDVIVLVHYDPEYCCPCPVCTMVLTLLS